MNRTSFTSMLKVDLRRMFTTKLFYIMIIIAVLIPILSIVMTSTTAGTTSIDPKTGVETVREGFSNTWQIIASPSDAETTMDIMSMGDINMLYFLIAIFVCIFVADDFRSGFAKILFTKHSKKGSYVISKYICGFITGAFMILAWLIGTMVAGAITGLSFDLGSAGIIGLIMCILAKIFLISIFVSISLFMGSIAKQKLWLSITLSLMIGMLLYMNVTTMAPLDSGIINVVMCLVGGLIFGIVFNLISKLILKKTDLV